MNSNTCEQCMQEPVQKGSNLGLNCMMHSHMAYLKAVKMELDNGLYGDTEYAQQLLAMLDITRYYIGITANYHNALVDVQNVIQPKSSIILPTGIVPPAEKFAKITGIVERALPALN